MLETLFQKDQAILKYLSPQKDNPAVLQKIKIVMARFKIVKSEIAEMKQHL